MTNPRRDPKPKAHRFCDVALGLGGELMPLDWASTDALYSPLPELSVTVVRPRGATGGVFAGVEVKLVVHTLGSGTDLPYGEVGQINLVKNGNPSIVGFNSLTTGEETI